MILSPADQTPAEAGIPTDLYPNFTVVALKHTCPLPPVSTQGVIIQCNACLKKWEGVGGSWVQVS